MSDVEENVSNVEEKMSDVDKARDVEVKVSDKAGGE